MGLVIAVILFCLSFLATGEHAVHAQGSLNGGSMLKSLPKDDSAPKDTSTKCKMVTVPSNEKSRAVQAERQQKACCLTAHKSGIRSVVQVSKEKGSLTYISCNVGSKSNTCTFKDPTGKYRSCDPTADKSGAGPAETAPPKDASPAPKTTTPSPSPAPSPSPSPAAQTPGSVQPGGYFNNPSPAPAPATNPTETAPTGGGLETFSSGPSYQQILEQEIGAAMNRAKDLYKRLSGGYAYVGPKDSPRYSDTLSGGRHQILSPSSGFKGRDKTQSEEEDTEDSPLDSFLSFLGFSRFSNARDEMTPRRNNDEVLALLHRYAATDSLSASVDVGRAVSIEDLDFSIQGGAPAVQPVIASGILPQSNIEQGTWGRTASYFTRTSVTLFNRSVVDAVSIFNIIANALREAWGIFRRD